MADQYNPEIYAAVRELVFINVPRVKQLKKAKEHLGGIVNQLLPKAGPDVHSAFVHTVGQIKDAREQFIRHRARADKYIFVVEGREELDPKSNAVTPNNTDANGWIADRGTEYRKNSNLRT
jgi:hypothetical protein